jgi:heme/copper-type cytochrome/quinol oxidase subunit 2
MISIALWICAAAAVVVFGFMLYSVASFNHDRNRDDRARTRKMMIEVFWSSIPILIVLSATAPIVHSLKHAVE